MTAIMGAGGNPGQFIENMPSSIVGAAQAIGAMFKEPKKLDPSYGLTYRFVVKINGLDLGKWASCKGLKRRFDPFALKMGGNYLSPTWLPGEVTYEKIVLQRAVDEASTRMLQKWLDQEAIEWITGTPKNNPASGTITLLDANGKKVLTWELKGVRPSAWNGPDLEATSAKVAIETLELVHEGFTVLAGEDKAQPSTAESKPLFVSLESKSPKGEVKFINTAKEVTVQHSSEPLTVPTLPSPDDDQAQSGQPQPTAFITGTTPTNITKLVLSDLYLTNPGGLLVEDQVQQLLDWMPKKVQDPNTKKLVEGQPTPLKVSWGDFWRGVLLTGVTVNYTRFDPNGIPIRAKVQLTLTITEKPPTGTNPTSGGIPGRRSHTLIAGEPLPLLAHQRYGNAANWRDIAEANNIDDPLRTRPGDALYLPAFAELPRRGERG